MKFYAGIGSRKAPQEILVLFGRIAARLAKRGYTLRSGAADGADAAFEAGCQQVSGACEIFLPWLGFNGHAPTKFLPTKPHYELAATVHPNWIRLKDSVRALHARNTGQILGCDLQSPVNFVVVWTPDGCESHQTRTGDTGGTGTAIALASLRGIPVVNFAAQDAMQRLARLV